MYRYHTDEKNRAHWIR